MLSACMLSSAQMSFFNSFKMKISIVFGVAQMSLGISLSLLNCLHWKDKRSIYCMPPPPVEISTLTLATRVPAEAPFYST